MLKTYLQQVHGISDASFGRYLQPSRGSSHRLFVWMMFNRSRSHSEDGESRWIHDGTVAFSFLYGCKPQRLTSSNQNQLCAFDSLSAVHDESLSAKRLRFWKETCAVCSRAVKHAC